MIVSPGAQLWKSLGHQSLRLSAKLAKSPSLVLAVKWSWINFIDEAMTLSWSTNNGIGKNGMSQ